MKKEKLGWELLRPQSSTEPGRSCCGGFLLGCRQVPNRFQSYAVLRFLPLTPLGRASLWGLPYAVRTSFPGCP